MHNDMDNVILWLLKLLDTWKQDTFSHTEL